MVKELIERIFDNPNFKEVLESGKAQKQEPQTVPHKYGTMPPSIERAEIDTPNVVKYGIPGPFQSGDESHK